MSIVTAFYRFEVLDEKIRTLNGFKSPNRYDCTAAYNPTGYGLVPLFQHQKGMLCLYLTLVREIVKIESRRRATYALTDGKQNLTSLFFGDSLLSQFCYGYPNGNRLLSNGQPNPAAPYKHDAFLLICDWQRQVIELLVIKNGKPLLDKLYNLLIQGRLTGEIERLRKLARPYYPYKAL